MINVFWTSRLLRRRAPRVVASAVGVAAAVALLALFGSFVTSSKATMTARSVTGISVDWQVEVQPTADPEAVARSVAAHPGVSAVQRVEFGTTKGYQSSIGGTTQITGPGVALGLPSGFRAAFPEVIRQLTGNENGVLLTQQTSANLHASPGDTVSIDREGLDPVRVTVAGIIELPQADSLFQKVGAPAGAQPQAPPDNAIVMPQDVWHATFDASTALHPSDTKTQVFAQLNHHLPNDPATAYSHVLGSAHNLEASLSGAGIVGNNIGATLDAARSDALYAQVLFVFLGVPGVGIAAMLTVAFSGIGRYRRRREQATLRARGASASQLALLAISEACLIGALGAIIGLATAALLATQVFGGVQFGSSRATSWAWGAGAAFAGMVVAMVSVALPAFRDARSSAVAQSRMAKPRRTRRMWMRLSVVVLLSAGSLVVYDATSRSGYTLVLAPEGTPALSVDYWAFLGPTCFWLALAIGTWTLVDILFNRATKVVQRASAQLAGRLGRLTAASMKHHGSVLAFAVVMICASTSFAISTSVFNATYKQQAEVDARLTNGADVTVTTSSDETNARLATELAGLANVRKVEPLQHRFAYVGNDLQDLYGVRPKEIARATSLPDAYFQGGTRDSLLNRLQSQPDALLVSAETVKDYQLQPGDSMRLRLTRRDAGSPVEVPFHYAGVIKEFPTAPRDSFLVANADYVAARTADTSANTYLVATNGSPATVAARARSLVGSTATVTDINSTRHSVGSSLTAVDLSRLTKLELAFALLFTASATGLMLALEFNERRRILAVASVLGASRKQINGAIRAEAIVVGLLGIMSGALGGWILSTMLVKVLNGAFDPPPATLSVPWSYLVAVLVGAIASILAAVLIVSRNVGRAPLEALRELQ